MLLLLLTGLSLYGITGACNKEFLNLFGTVTSPNYSTNSKYAANLDCIFDIEVEKGERIQLQWNSFDIVGTMPDCSTDYVEIFVGCNRNSIGKYCSSNFASKSTLYTVYSADNCLRLKFHSDGSDSGKGFSARYTTYASGSVLGTACSLSTKRLTADSGVIISPGWPVSYPPLQDCYWKIELGHSKGIKMAFMDFDLEFDSGCNRDKVKVKGGDTGDSYDNSDTVKSSVCGSRSPFSLTSSKDVIWVRFKTDSFNSNPGFVAGYVLYDSKAEIESTAGVVVGIVVVVGVIAVIAGIVCFIVMYQRKRGRMAQRHVQQATVMTSVTHQSQAPAPYTHPPPPPEPSHVPPPYNQAVAAPYPKQAYPPDHYGGAPPYPTGHPGDAPPYPTGHPGDAPLYPTGHPGDAPLYPTGHPGDAPPYPTRHPGDAPPYPTGHPGDAPPYPTRHPGDAPPYPPQPGGGLPYPPGPSATAPPFPPGPIPYPPEGYPSKPPLA